VAAEISQANCEFKDGDRVRLKNDPSRAGVVQSAQRMLGTKLHLAVDMSDGSGICFLPVHQLEAVAANVDALADLRAGKVSSPEDLRRLLTHVRLTSQLSDVIYSMETTNTDFHAYQFKPVVKILNSASRGLLIADEVGLGKTIEAGLVWTELVARFSVSRLLIVCPKSLTEKWKMELRNKFAISAQITDAKGLLQALKDEPESGEGFALICSLSSLRPPKGWDSEKGTKNARVALANFLNDQSDGDALFDLAVFDEAHHLRNSETSQHMLGRLVLDVADHKLLLSATPINLRSNDLRNLLRLLDPDTFENEYMFAIMEAENAPLVAAREKALDLKTNLGELLEVIRNMPSGNILKTDQRMAILHKQLASADLKDSPRLRAGIAAQLEEMSLLGSIVNRTRRRDVNELQVKRRAFVYRWTMSDVEREFYEKASNVVREHAWSVPANDRFLLATPQRLIASSLPAAFEHWKAKAVGFSIDDEDEAEFWAENNDIGPLTAKLAVLCMEENYGDQLRQNDTKYEALRKALAKNWESDPNEKLILFSSFRRTIDYLADRLEKDGVRIEKMHGSISEERQDVLDRFANATEPVVLLTSEVGGEGLDLQFCRRMVNYDLPWNPMKVEQRIGRIDRIGQEAESIEIVNLICEDTIEAQVYDRLYARLGIIEQTLGSFEMILGQELNDLEKRLLDPKLTKAERGKEIERAAVAYENRQKQESELEEEAAGLIAHGDMIMDRIHENYTEERRIGPDELADYVRSAIEGQYPGSRLEPRDSGSPIWNVRLNGAAHFEFTEFLKRHARRYQTILRKSASGEILFGKPDKNAKNVEAVGPTHPLVRFVSSIKDRLGKIAPPRPAVLIRIKRDRLELDLEPGVYCAAVQSWSARGIISTDRMAFSCVSSRGGPALDPDTAERLCRRSLEHGELLHDVPGREALADIIKTNLIEGDLSARHSFFADEESARHEDRAQTTIAQFRRHRDRRKGQEEARHAEWTISDDPKKLKILPAARAKLDKFLVRMDAKIADAESRAGFGLPQEKTLGVQIIEIV